MKPFTVSAKTKAQFNQHRLFRVRVLEKRDLWESPTFISSKNRSSKKILQLREKHGKTKTHTCSGQTFCQKKYGFQQKGNHIFSGQTWCQKKYECKNNSTEFQRKGTHTFFGPNIVPKKYECQKKVWVPKTKELILFSANIVPKKVWVPKTSMTF